MQAIRAYLAVITTMLLLPTAGRSQGFELRQESESLYWLRATGGSQDQVAVGGKAGKKADEWRLPYPVYRFQTGDIDGDGSEDGGCGKGHEVLSYGPTAVHLQADRWERENGETSAGRYLDTSEVSEADVVGVETRRHP